MQVYPALYPIVYYESLCTTRYNVKPPSPRLLLAPRGLRRAGALLVLVLTAPTVVAATPWRLAEALHAPAALHLEGSYRLRYETLDGQFRRGGRGGDQVLAERLWLAAEYDFGAAYAGAEFADARTQFEDAGTPLGTDDVNALEPQQAYLGYRGRDRLVAGDSLDVRAGRQTLDLGSRRLVARNQFRNTPNAFTGLVARWHDPSGQRLTAFFTLPLERRPARPAALADDRVALDRERAGVHFWGVDYARDVAAGMRAEAYVLALDEAADAGGPTRARELYTPGLRAWRGATRGRFDFEWESALQLGRSRLAAATDAVRLQHFAHFHHLSLGYTCNDAWRTRLVVQYDYASGDDQPGDGDNGRFDTLFGARRFEFGPTGIAGAILRSNVSTPGARLEIAPTAGLAAFAGYRAILLAAARDAWIPAGVQDLSGAAGSTVGHQLELNLAWDLRPGNLRWEGGAAGLINGRFLDEAPTASGASGTFYAYGQLVFTF